VTAPLVYQNEQPFPLRDAPGLSKPATRRLLFTMAAFFAL
jgi:hypothetical protein